MDAYLQLTTVFLSGIFGLLVAVVTTALTGYRESRSQKRTVVLEQRTQLEKLYTEHIAVLEKAIRYTESSLPFSELYDDLALINARMRLFASPEVITASEEASDLLHQWSRAYRAGMPKPIGDSGTAIISSNDSKHIDQAKELFPKLHDQLNAMIEKMKSHIDGVRAA